MTVNICYVGDSDTQPLSHLIQKAQEVGSIIITLDREGNWIS